MRINLYFSEEKEKELIDYLLTKRDPKSYIKDLIFNDKNNIVVTSNVLPEPKVQSDSKPEIIMESKAEEEEKKRVDVKKVMKKNRGMLLK